MTEQSCTHCSTVFRARPQWDGEGYPALPSKLRFKIERYEHEYTASMGYWALKDRHTRTAREAWDTYLTRAIPNVFDVDGERTRACARRAIQTGGEGYGYGYGYGSYGS